MGKHEEDHETLLALCANCQSDNMKVQFSDTHGIVIGCYRCGTVVFTAQDGNHLDVALARISKRGCMHTELHKGEKNN